MSLALPSLHRKSPLFVSGLLLSALSCTGGLNVYMYLLE